MTSPSNDAMLTNAAISMNTPTSSNPRTPRTKRIQPEPLTQAQRTEIWQLYFVEHRTLAYIAHLYSRGLTTIHKVVHQEDYLRSQA